MAAAAHRTAAGSKATASPAGSIVIPASSEERMVGLLGRHSCNNVLAAPAAAGQDEEGQQQAVAVGRSMRRRVAASRRCSSEQGQHHWSRDSAIWFWGSWRGSQDGGGWSVEVPTLPAAGRRSPATWVCRICVQSLHHLQLAKAWPQHRSRSQQLSDGATKTASA